MNRFARLATIAAALGVGAPVASARAQADARPSVAVMLFNNDVPSKDARDYDGLRKGIADFLISEMAATPNLRLIARDRVQKLIDEQKLVTGGQVDRELAVRVGKLLGAQHVVFGGYMADPKGNVRIDARAVGVEQGVIEYSERVQDKADNVMELIGEGKRNKEIATALHISEETVQVHVRNLFAKLNVGGRTEALTVALRRGIIHIK